MQLLNWHNLCLAILIILMIGCLKKTLSGDIDENKFFYAIAFLGLGIILYFWKSGIANEVIAYMHRPPP